MNIPEESFQDSELFREFLPDLQVAFTLGNEDLPEVWALRAYALRTGTFPIGLFIAILQDRGLWCRPQEGDHREGERARLGKEVAATMLTREELIEEMKRFRGEVLIGGHEVLNMGVDHRGKGLLSWQKIGTEDLERWVSDLKAGRCGELPEFLSPEQAAKLFGVPSLAQAVKNENPSP